MVAASSPHRSIHRIRRMAPSSTVHPILNMVSVTHEFAPQASIDPSRFAGVRNGSGQKIVLHFSGLSQTRHEHTMGVNSLPKTVTRQRRDW